MPTTRLPVLLSPETVLQHLDNDQVKIIYVGTEEKYAEGHIPGAVRISHSDLNHGVSPLAGHLPSSSLLEMLFNEIGLRGDDHVVCCDDDSGTAAARLFWVLEAMGHPHVSFLDGGMLAWNAADLPLSTDTGTCQPGNWAALPNPDIVATKEYVFNTLENPQNRILDARSEEEHGGIKSASDRKGHIPGAVSMNWLTTRDTQSSNRFQALAELQQTLDQRGLDNSTEIIVHCQTHQRSCHSYVMLRALGYEKIRGFAGSWSEWAADADMPVVNLQQQAS